MAEDQYMTVGEAREILGVSRAKMTRLIETGDLPTEPDPLDKRVKKVRRADVERLKSQALPRKNSAA